MRILQSFLFLCVLVLAKDALCADPELEEQELKARAFLRHLNVANLENNHMVTIAEWNYDSNITEYNKREKLAKEAEFIREEKKQWEEVNKFDWRNFKDSDVKRQFKILSVLGEAILSPDKSKRNSKILADMAEIYSSAKICEMHNKTKCDLALEPDLDELFSTSQNEELLKYTWLEWRNAVGPKVKHMYKEHVELSNEAARLNNFTNTGEFWLNNYDTPDIKDQIEHLWTQLKPFYLQLHAYVRHKLREMYGDVVSEKGPIPAHILGNMWGQSWASLYKKTKPYDVEEAASITEELVKQNYDAHKIFKTAEDFFTSINLTAMPEKFWKNSMLEKPKNREVVCHPAAYDFYDGEDFRIRQCTVPTQEHFMIAHHEMGHIEYFLQYKHLPFVYRRGANEGFHEAIGDVIALSVQTLKHLRKLGLTQLEDNEYSEINNLYNLALSKLVFLPFGYIMDLWRWDVFSGKIHPGEYNCKWWKFVEDYQGLEPPVDRTEKDFDAACKYHIIADVPYIRYFVSHIIQFQFHRSLCLKAGEYDPHDPSKPLHRCDIYQNAEAGNLFGKMLQMGGSRSWQDAMEVVTGQRNMDANGYLEYFRPLKKFLEAENEKNGVFVGWEPSKKVCVKSRKDLNDHHH